MIGLFLIRWFVERYEVFHFIYFFSSSAQPMETTLLDDEYFESYAALQSYNETSLIEDR